MMTVLQSTSTTSSTWWQNILWREAQYTADRDYRRYVRQLTGQVSTGWHWRFQGRPLVFEVEIALRQGSRVTASRFWSHALQLLTTNKTQPAPPAKFIEKLHSASWMDRFVAKHLLVHWGGEAVDLLRRVTQDPTSSQQETAFWLLKSIQGETSTRLSKAPQAFFCTRCWRNCTDHTIDLALHHNLKFYGCRSCGQSRALWHAPHGCIGVLDSHENAAYALQEGVLRINWLLHQDLFDFDRVEIRQATDEQVERFCVQVGNDTAELHQARYATMTVLLGPRVELSENTLKILERTFGRLKGVIDN